MPTGSLEERDARPWQELAETILGEIPEGTCTLVYNMAFEKGVLQDLAAFLPEDRKGLFAVIDGLVDLMEPFRRREIYHWEMAGSYSLKNVLPVLVPELSYEGLTISHGDMASEAYFTMGGIGDHEKEWEKPCERPARESVMPIRNRHLHRRDPRDLDTRGARGIKLPKVLSFPIGTRLLLQETQKWVRRNVMKKKLFAGLLTATLCFAHFPVMAQSGQPDSGENQFHAFQEARQHHWWKTADMRQQVRLKMLELAAMMANPKSTEDELLKKQGELQGARAILENEQLSFLYQMKQKYPEVVGSCGMSGHGMGMGPCGMGCGTMGRGHGMGHGAKGGHHMGDGMMGGQGIGTGPCGMGHCMMGGGWN